MNISSYLLSNFCLRSVCFVGFQKTLVPGVVSLFNLSVEIHVLDDLKKDLWKSKKIRSLEAKNSDLKYGKAIYDRTIQLAELLMSMRHLGYYRPINGNTLLNIEALISELPKENKSNILVIKENLLTKTDFIMIYKKILDKKNIIFCIVFSINDSERLKLHEIDSKDFFMISRI